MVDLERLEQWYARKYQLPSLEKRSAKEHFEQLAAWLVDAFKRDSSGLGIPIHQLLGIGQDKGAAFLVMIYAYAHLRQFECRPEVRDLPAGLLTLYRIACIDAHADKVPSQF